MRPMVIGETVHYTGLGTAGMNWKPAIITRVKDAENMIVTLRIIFADVISDIEDVSYSPHHQKGHWSYPENNVAINY